jgi:hypothetical protein
VCFKVGRCAKTVCVNLNMTCLEGISLFFDMPGGNFAVLYDMPGGNFAVLCARNRALQRSQEAAPAKATGEGFDLNAFLQRQQGYLESKTVSTNRAAQEMLAAAKPPDFMTLIQRNRG